MDGGLGGIAFGFPACDAALEGPLAGEPARERLTELSSNVVDEVIQAAA
jgi:hypothetical protein